jgi:hypothetical protein
MVICFTCEDSHSAHFDMKSIEVFIVPSNFNESFL